MRYATLSLAMFLSAVTPQRAAYLNGAYYSTVAVQANVVGVGQVCTQTTAGNVLVSPFLLNPEPLTPGESGSSIPPRGPKKIVLSEDLPGATLVCRETETGSACRTIAQLFPAK